MAEHLPHPTDRGLDHGSVSGCSTSSGLQGARVLGLGSCAPAVRREKVCPGPAAALPVWARPPPVTQPRGSSAPGSEPCRAFAQLSSENIPQALWPLCQVWQRDPASLESLCSQDAEGTGVAGGDQDQGGGDRGRLCRRMGRLGQPGLDTTCTPGATWAPKQCSRERVSPTPKVTLLLTGTGDRKRNGQQAEVHARNRPGIYWVPVRWSPCFGFVCLGSHKAKPGLANSGWAPILTDRLFYK